MWMKCMAGGSDLVSLQGPFQPTPFYDDYMIFTLSLSVLWNNCMQSNYVSDFGYIFLYHILEDVITSPWFLDVLKASGTGLVAIAWLNESVFSLTDRSVVRICILVPRLSRYDLLKYDKLHVEWTVCLMCTTCISCANSGCTVQVLAGFSNHKKE